MNPRPEPGTERFTALVLAGSRGRDDPVARHCGLEHKCLAPVGGRPMLARVLETLAQSSSIGQILVSVPDPALLQGLAPTTRATPLVSAATPSMSVLQALDEAQASLPLLITTADHPLLTPAMVDGFCAAARADGADLVAGLTEARVIQAAYPQAQRTYLRFRDGAYSGANLFALLTPASRRAVVFWRRVEQERKRPWRLVRAFGVMPLLLYLLGRLSLDEAMRRASGVIGARVAVARLPFAEAAIDVDKPADLALVEAILSRGSA